MAGEFATSYDGTNDYYTLGSDLTGNANSKLGILSVYVLYPTAVGTVKEIIFGENADIKIYLSGVGQYVAVLRDVLNAAAITINSSIVAASSSWVHVLMSWDTGNAKSYLYINDTSDNTESENNNLEIDYTQSGYGVGGRNTGAEKFVGSLSELYYNTAEYLDFSVEANRRKFISASGKPVPLGADGSGPTGTAAIIYAPDGNPVVNQGTGGNFTENGAPVRIAGPGDKKTIKAALIDT